MLAKALESLDRSVFLQALNVSCDDNVPWSSGANLYDYLKMVSVGDLQMLDISMTNNL